MKPADIYSIIFKRNQNALIGAVEGLSHEHGLLQLPGSSNCMNWLLGHIATYRDGLLSDAGLDQHMSVEEVSLYGSGSDPIDVGCPCVDFIRLVELQELTYVTLNNWLINDPDNFDASVDKNLDSKKGYGGYWTTVGEHLSQMIGHESMHIGELSALRELALVSKV